MVSNPDSVYVTPLAVARCTLHVAKHTCDLSVRVLVSQCLPYAFDYILLTYVLHVDMEAFVYYWTHCFALWLLLS